MKFFDRIVNAVRPTRVPRPGALVHRSRDDAWRDYPADGLTPQKLVSIFRQADAGSLSAQLSLFEQMEEKDAHLFSVATTRRLAVTGLPWEIVASSQLAGGSRSEPSSSQRAEADRIAAHCDAIMRNLPGLDDSLRHLALAIGRNLSVVELIWESTGDGPRLAQLAPIDFDRLTIGPLGELRILTDQSKFEGIELPPDKFIVHSPQSASGHPMRGGILRASALAYLGKHFAIKDWLIFAEVYGMPVRVARYAPNATQQEKQELLNMLKQLGADAAGVFSKAVELQVIQSRLAGETNLYENLCLYFDREISKAWLGQTLTTDTARMLASAGAAQVHDEVRRDLRDNDLRQEAATIRRDLLAPLVRFQFGPDAPVPYFQRIIDQRFDPTKLGSLLAVMVNDLGARVPAGWAHATLGVPQAQPGDAVLPGAQKPAKNKGGTLSKSTH